MEGRSGSTLPPISETRQTSSFKQESKSRTLTKQRLTVHESAVSEEVHQQSHEQSSGTQSNSKTWKPLKFLIKLKDCFVEQLLTPVDDRPSATGMCSQTVGMLNLRGCEAIGISLASNRNL
jgi:hypothetical protein